MQYEDFELQVGPRSGAGVLFRVLRSPAGEAEAVLEIPESDLMQPSRRDRDLAAPNLKSLSDAERGERLFRAVFRGEIGDLFLQSLSRVSADGHGLRIRLRINPRDRSLAGLQQIPWELLYRPETEDFLALSHRTPIVRSLDVQRSSAPSRVKPPLRILIATAQQPAYGALDLAGELSGLSTALRTNPSIEIQVVEQADSGALRKALIQTPFHVLHYMGHGVFDPTTGQGALLFAGAGGLAEAVTGRHLATKIKDFASLRLVVLNACRTALANVEGTAGPFAGVATALVLGGVPAVVAMRSSIADLHAVAFSAAFYDRLARGMTLEEAVTEGRQAIYSISPEGADWTIPVVFQRNVSGPLLQPFEELSVPPARSSHRLRLRIAAGVSALLLVGAAAELPHLAGWSKAPPVQQTTPISVPEGSEQSRAEDRKAIRREPASVPSAQASSGKREPAAKPTTINGLRIEITGAPPAGLASAVRRTARTLTASGWTLRLDVHAPRIAPYNESGLSWLSCSLTAEGSAEGHGVSADLGTISAVRSKAESGAACEAAAEDLAERAVRNLQPYLKEESK